MSIPGLQQILWILHIEIILYMFIIDSQVGAGITYLAIFYEVQNEIWNDIHNKKQ